LYFITSRALEIQFSNVSIPALNVVHVTEHPRALSPQPQVCWYALFHSTWGNTSWLFLLKLFWLLLNQTCKIWKCLQMG